MGKCLVICPFGEPGSQTRQWSDFVMEEIIRPAVGGLHEVGRTIDLPKTGNIIRRLHRELSEAEVVIADLTGANANVAYELGLRHEFGGSAALMCRKDSPLPFDLSVLTTVKVDATYDQERKSYECTSLAQAIADLRQQVLHPGGPLTERYRARAFAWTTTYQPFLEAEWLERQEARLQEQILAFDADEKAIRRRRPTNPVLSKFAEYRELKAAANQQYNGLLCYFVSPFDQSLVDGHAIYQFATSSSMITASGREAGRSAQIKFNQPPREVQTAGLKIKVPGFSYTVDFRHSAEDCLSGELVHPDTGTLLGRAELASKWTLGL